jgi:hypothetical protein
VSIVCLLPLLPGQLWDRCSQRQPERSDLPTIYCYQTCRFYRDAATIVVPLLRIEAAPLISAQSNNEV